MFFIIIPLILLITVFLFLFICIKASYNEPEHQARYTSSYYVITVKNCEDSIEGILRSTIWQIHTSGISPQELVVIDLDSEDMTGVIIRQLSKEYPFISPMSKTDYIQFISEL